MSVWREGDKPQAAPHRAYSLQEIAIFAGGLFAAAVAGLLCSGGLPGLPG